MEFAQQNGACSSNSECLVFHLGIECTPGQSIRPHDWVPVLVTGVDERAVHLDANFSVEGTTALVHVDVQSLYKQI
eukprot:1160032-Pelagomonas_calceolata.AAC.9